ncbi:MAG: HD domain-containing protein [Firmicutes bacterium]|nr:HD domain-containing protein [Bacillota bacterium]
MISDLREGNSARGYYLCKEKQLLKSKAGKNYLSLTLQDASGSINGKVWDLNVRIGEFDKGDVVLAEGSIVTFAGDLQMNISRIRRCEAGEYDMADLTPSTDKDRDQMYRRILEWIDSLSKPYYQKLLNAFYRDDARLVDKIKQHPAAKSVHHNYLGGYLEHVTSVTDIAVHLAGLYENVDLELVITGALLHDIGKLWELNPMPLGDYTNEGQLLGHVMIGYAKVGEKLRLVPDFPRGKAVELEHIILSHHGELEFGSPKVPATMEAMIIHLADNSDAKLKLIEETLKTDRAEGDWTEYNRFLSRTLYKGGQDRVQP